MKRDPHETGGIPIIPPVQVYLFHGRTCVNPRSPYPSIESAMDGARTRQMQSRMVGQTPIPYRIVQNGEVIATVLPS